MFVHVLSTCSSLDSYNSWQQQECERFIVHALFAF
jgi:hypothetical protein